MENFNFKYNAIENSLIIKLLCNEIVLLKKEIEILEKNITEQKELIELQNQIIREQRNQVTSSIVQNQAIDSNIEAFLQDVTCHVNQNNKKCKENTINEKYLIDKLLRQYKLLDNKDALP